jgi:hypothetical protein
MDSVRFTGVYWFRAIYGSLFFLLPSSNALGEGPGVRLNDLNFFLFSPFWGVLSEPGFSQASAEGGLASLAEIAARQFGVGGRS